MFSLSVLNIVFNKTHSFYCGYALRHSQTFTKFCEIRLAHIILVLSFFEKLRLLYYLFQ